MAIADESESSYNRIQQSGFQSCLSDLIAYAETQASLHQSLGAKSQWEYWVKAWASLRWVSDGIDDPDQIREAEQLWFEYREGNLDFDIDLDSD